MLTTQDAQVIRDSEKVANHWFIYRNHQKQHASALVKGSIMQKKTLNQTAKIDFNPCSNVVQIFWHKYEVYWNNWLMYEAQYILNCNSNIEPRSKKNL